MNIMKNKRGWLKIVEAFSAILLVWVVLLTVVNQTSIKREDISSEVYDQEVRILREIQLNGTLRDIILDLESTSLPVYSGSANFPILLNQTINNSVPSYLSCRAKICLINDKCDLEGGEKISSREIYAQQVLIIADAYDFSSKKLKLFCWQRN